MRRRPVGTADVTPIYVYVAVEVPHLRAAHALATAAAVPARMVCDPQGS
jgi:hypothetical protein